jgi:Xaa-Pro dipeptidase
MQDYTKKLDRIVAEINNRNLDGLIIYSCGTVNLLRPSYLCYFAGYRPFGPNSAALITRSGDVRLLVEPAWDEKRSAEQSNIRNTVGTDNFNRDLSAMLRQASIKTIGLIGSKEMTGDILDLLQATAAVKTSDDIIEQMARVKTPEEIENIRKVAKIADIGFEVFLEYSRPGIREYELCAELNYAMRAAGADDNFILMSSEKHNLAMHPSRDKKLTEGSIVLGEITPVLNGQYIQLCRTVVLGEPSALLREKYLMLEKAFEASLNTMKAGVPAGLLSKAMNKVISDAGYAKYCYPPYMRARGHGFGVGSISPGGTVDDSTEAILENQQVVIVHPNQYLPETGYLACGETVLVTPTGIERLSEQKTTLYVKEV